MTEVADWVRLVFCVSHHKEAVTVVLNPAVCVCVELHLCYSP